MSQPDAPLRTPGAAETGDGVPSRSDARTRASSGEAFVAALGLACEPSPNHALHAARILSLERAVAASPAPRRRHVARMIEAALEAEASHRVALGLPPLEGRLFRGWVDLPTSAVEPEADPAGTVDRPYLQRVGIPASGIIETLGAVTTEADGIERAWDGLAAIAFASCFEQPAACRGGRDRRRALAILWATLRRRRPIVAAVVRRCATFDRRWRATSGGGT